MTSRRVTGGLELMVPLATRAVIMVKALKTQSVEPVMVMILSGQEPSEMLTRALLCVGVRGQVMVNVNA
ncbi:hypothetical protein EYF80_040415 [Liparis tanakae]|uniref:Uncharacterized protein n=1 Tax=Liparis tanakae TaxID=230148 RepID=A0A4Z2G8X7_9TELE|nr:hypothetical protein EYF80_040415 [Liparis tanakae]